MGNRILVMIPTYNELNNVVPLTCSLINLNMPLDILFIDDNSPDGTGIKLDRIKGLQRCGDLHVIHRSGKLGVGSAHKLGINYAYANGFDILITMDCDGTHDPLVIPSMLLYLSSKLYPCDVVVGSRHIMDGSLDGWSRWRKFVTRVGHILTTVLLKMPYDATGAFRGYNITQINHEIFNRIDQDGYAFFFESLTILNMNRIKISEIPIKLAARSAGKSKLRLMDLVNSLLFMIKLRGRMVFAKRRLVVTV